MAFKETKRKGFNFFRSYYDVFNELPEKDKLPFIKALLDRQFLGIKPNDLTGMAKFAWISQVNSIDSQVKGYEDKTGIKLNPTQGGVTRVKNTPTLQVEEKGKEKEKVKYNIKEELKPIFLTWLDYRKEIKKPVKNKKTLEALTKKFNSFELSKCEWVVNNSIEQNYQGLFWENYKPKTNKTTKPRISF